MTLPYVVARDQISLCLLIELDIRANLIDIKTYAGKIAPHPLAPSPPSGRRGKRKGLPPLAFWQRARVRVSDKVT